MLIHLAVSCSLALWPLALTVEEQGPGVCNAAYCFQSVTVVVAPDKKRNAADEVKSNNVPQTHHRKQADVMRSSWREDQ